MRYGSPNQRIYEPVTKERYMHKINYLCQEYRDGLTDNTLEMCKLFFDYYWNYLDLKRCWYKNSMDQIVVNPEGCVLHEEDVLDIITEDLFNVILKKYNPLPGSHSNFFSFANTHFESCLRSKIRKEAFRMHLSHTSHTAASQMYARASKQSFVPVENVLFKKNVDEDMFNTYFERRELLDDIIKTAKELPHGDFLLLRLGFPDGRSKTVREISQIYDETSKMVNYWTDKNLKYLQKKYSRK